MATKTKAKPLPAARIDVQAKALGAIAIEDLHDSPFNPRRRYDEKGLEELAGSYRMLPTAVPDLLVRPRPSGDGYELVAGHRRKRAAARAGLTELPCKLLEVDDHVARALQHTENGNREALHPLDEADSYASWLKEIPGTTVEAIAAEVGRPVAFVRGRLALARLPEAARAAFEEGKLGIGQARLIAGLATEKDQADALAAALEERWGDGPMSVRELAGWIEEELTLDLERAKWVLDDGQLLPAAGPCTACPKRTGASADLFAGAVEGDRCLDKTCWEAKLDAHVRAAQEAGREEVAEVARGGHTVVKVATPEDRQRVATELREQLEEDARAELELAKDAPLPAKTAKEIEADVERRVDQELQWEGFTAGCSSAVDAVVTGSGPRKGELVKVCRDPECTVHGEKNKPRSSSSGSDYQAQAKRDAEKRRLEAKVRGRVLGAVVASLRLEDGHLKRVDLGEVAEVVLPGYRLEHVAKALGMAKAPKVSDLALADLSKFIFAGAFADELSEYGAHRGRLLGVARRMKIDVDKIRKDLKDEAKPKKKAAPAKSSPKKKAAKKAKAKK